VDLTTSFLESFPGQTQARFEFYETRNAAGILAITNPLRFNQLIEVLNGFSLLTSDLVESGGNESKLAALRIPEYPYIRSGVFVHVSSRSKVA
jgi:hypothetical protein